MVCAATAKAQRLIAERDEEIRAEWGDNPPAERDDPADGRSLGLRITPAIAADHD